jgi:hypothetical protein
LPQQSVEVLVATSHHDNKWSGKVISGVELLFNQSVRFKLFSVVIGQSLDPYSEGLELLTLDELTNSEVLLDALAKTTYTLLRSTIVTTAPLRPAEITM